MKLKSVLRLAACLAASHWAGAAAAQATGTAPQCCGLLPIHNSSQKSMVGTAANSASSSIYFTGYEGNVSEVYYPTVDTLATSNMEFLVGDGQDFRRRGEAAELGGYPTRPQIYALAGGD